MFIVTVVSSISELIWENVGYYRLVITQLKCTRLQMDEDQSTLIAKQANFRSTEVDLEAVLVGVSHPSTLQVVSVEDIVE